VLLDAVHVEHDDGAEGVVLREPEGAEDLRVVHFVDDTDDAHGGVETLLDVFLDVGGVRGGFALFCGVQMGRDGGRGVVILQGGKGGEEERAVDEEHDVVVG